MRTESEAKSTVLAESVSVLFMSAIVGFANGLHAGYILFPELGAVSSDVLLRPNGKWAKSPWKLIATPTITAAAGVLINSRMHYGVLSILAGMCAGLAALRLLNSAVAPAISAGVLPIVVGITSWLYPLCILGTLSILTLLLIVWRATPYGRLLAPDKGEDRNAVEILESKPSGKWWFLSLFLFVTIVGLAAQISTWRFILFPPLIVMAYEMLGHPDTCPWARAPYTFPLVCSAAALAGVEFRYWFGITPIAAATVLILTYLMLRLFRLRLPPALAIGLIPFIAPSPSVVYAYSVGIGTTALTLWFLLTRSFVGRPA